MRSKLIQTWCVTLTSSEFVNEACLLISSGFSQGHCAAWSVLPLTSPQLPPRPSVSHARPQTQHAHTHRVPVH